MIFLRQRDYKVGGWIGSPCLKPQDARKKLMAIPFRRIQKMHQRSTAMIQFLHLGKNPSHAMAQSRTSQLALLYAFSKSSFTTHLSYPSIYILQHNLYPTNIKNIFRAICRLILFYHPAYNSFQSVCKHLGYDFIHAGY